MGIGRAVRLRPVSERLRRQHSGNRFSRACANRCRAVPAPASAAAKSSATHGLASDAGAGGLGSLADVFARAGKDSGRGAGKKSDNHPGKAGAKSEKPAEAAVQADSIGDDVAKAFFAEFDKAITSGSSDGIRAAMFYQATIHKALHGIEACPKPRKPPTMPAS